MISYSKTPLFRIPVLFIFFGSFLNVLKQLNLIPSKSKALYFEPIGLVPRNSN